MIAIDLGSNSLRVLEYDCNTSKQISAYEKVVKTADGLAQSGLINDNAIKRVITAIKEMKSKVDFSSHLVKAVTTEAVRRASNSDEVLARIKKETGVVFDIILGDEEARLTLLAVKNRLTKLQYASESFVLVDIGGGSTELIFHYGSETISKSFPVGIVTIAQSYEDLNNIQKALPKEMVDMEMFCAEVYDTKGKPSSFVATAGTPTTVAAMKLGFNYETYDAAKINGTSLQKDELDFYLKKLLSLAFEEREIAVGTGRSDLIAAGILIYKQLYTLLEFNTCVVVDDGLREGVALEMCHNL
ncbi:phosphatase [Sulfurovum sp.]|uniref:Ppx/GppA phosphatase family protein n=1 Tax=Sulfurovum sp. TaxID=1969726 RepID=UPI0028681CE3|nr:phosphatase [Sulfurovum sp.]